MNRLTKVLLEEKADILAPKLLGKILSFKSSQGLISGRIVETEAYLSDDPACHASVGKTKRNQMMFASGGVAYLYKIYGIHFCFNVVSGQSDSGEAVLIRALEPIQGLDLMKINRGLDQVKNLTNGPGKLCQAMGLDLSLDGEDLIISDKLFLLDDGYIHPEGIITTTRIGISKAIDYPLRFYLKDNIFISRK